eukprot:4251644-Prymnesium_polylepis.1
MRAERARPRSRGMPPAMSPRPQTRAMHGTLQHRRVPGGGCVCVTRLTWGRCRVGGRSWFRTALPDELQVQ